MARYRVDFVDHGGNVFSTEHVECVSDEEAIRAVQRLDVPSIGAGFEVCCRGRLI